ncbi:S8 family serine peptidase [Dactylosporangium fulvum]|uniref:S8 family serine peptidase n=1 Tax=Dactylosporangium fulvum TaxID=53359 RepID=A0ABY5WCX0_9ACTN|nr:S8 family serine peptidase [Dactylosporangium fulvum]UWP87171.1 S8 family serine peptidase [Dactylosporangium fulvum]
MRRPVFVLAAVLAVSGIAVAPARADVARPGEAWHVELLRLAEAHRLSRGDGVTVALLGDGVDDHRDLKGALLPAVDVATVKSTSGGHRSTHAAGLIAARGDGGTGLLGIAPRAKVLPVRVGAGTKERDPAAVARGIDAAVAARAGVIALPDPNTEVTGDLRRAVRAAVAAGAVVVAPAGLAWPVLPTVAALPGVVSVVATDRDRRPVANSQTGLDLDLAAPGDNLVSVARLASGDGHLTSAGTDLAPAVVAGVAALVRAKYPDASGPDVIRRLHVTALGPVQHNPQVGWGLVDPVTALTATLPVLPAAVAQDGGPARDQQWYLDALRVPQTQRVTRGAGVTIGFVGNGVDAGHPDLQGQVSSPAWYDGKGGDVRTDAPPGPVRDALAVDASGHTGVVSVMVAKGGTGLLGVAPEAEVVAVGGIGGADELTGPAVRWLTGRGVRVMLIPGGPLDQGSVEAVAGAVRRGAVVVRPAHPENPDLSGVLTVGAVDGTGERRAAAADLVAPGEPMLVAAAGQGGYTGAVEPDTAAAGYVAAVAALIRAARPDLDVAGVLNRLLRTASPASAVRPRIVDPFEAVTADVPATDRNPIGDPGPVHPDAVLPSEDGPLPAVATAAALLVAAAAVTVVLARRRRRV